MESDARRFARKRKAAAFHEAAHAVARLHVGAPATRVVIAPGRSHTAGTRGRWRARGNAERKAWARVLCLFAGAYAEAFACRRSLGRTIATSGGYDLREAARWVAWLVAHGHARNPIDALDRTHRATFAFLYMRWDAVERVAAALLEDGRLTARQVLRLAQGH